MTKIDKRPTSPQRVGASRAKKEKIVAELSEKVQKAKAMVFANYQGMTHKQIEELKRHLQKVDAELTVTKNTLLKIALKANQESGIRNNDKIKSPDSQFIIHDSTFEGATATLFAYSDTLLPLKELAKTIKSLKLPVIKFGIFEGKVLSVDEVLKLSTLPSREILLAQFVGGLKSPIFGLHRALSWNIQKLVLTLEQIKNQKSNSKNTK